MTTISFMRLASDVTDSEKHSLRQWIPEIPLVLPNERKATNQEIAAFLTYVSVKYRLVRFWDFRSEFYYDGLLINEKDEGLCVRTSRDGYGAKSLPSFLWFAKCLHEYEVRTPYNCFNVYTCRKCGYSYSIDSSG